MIQISKTRLYGSCNLLVQAIMYDTQSQLGSIILVRVLLLHSNLLLYTHRRSLQRTMAKGGKMLVGAAAALVAVCHLEQSTFVPAPVGRAMPMAAGAVAMLGAAPAFADKIDDAAKTLSAASYPFLKEIDWNGEYYQKLPGSTPSQVLDALKPVFAMGAAMDPKALKAGMVAHVKAIGSIDDKGVTTQADYEAINAAIGHMVASVPAWKVLDVYGAFANLVTPEIQAYLPSTVNKADAEKAYQAFLDFKDVVKASQK
jgi:hypothetical protein